MVPSTLGLLDASVRNAAAILREKSRAGRGVLGYFHPVVPEELIYAAGLHPARLYCWHREEPITLADSHLPAYLCSNVRHIWDQILKGAYPFLEGAIIPRSCEAVTFLYPTWTRFNPYQFVDYLNVPCKISSNTIGFFAKELERVKAVLEKHAGKEISEDSLRSAIKVYNRNRQLLKQVYELRKADSPPVSGVEAFNIVMSSFILPKEEHNQLMEDLINELAQRRRLETGPRILLSGGCVIDRKIWEIVESSGACIVADDTNNTSRSFWHSVEDSADNPLEALARSYIGVPCAFNTNIDARFNYISRLINEFRINGVIFAINRHCESEKLVYPELSRKLKARFSVPTLNIETDHSSAVMPLRTRVQAFVETLTL